MGLDMYLEARRYVSKYNDADKAKADELRRVFHEITEDTPVSGITLEAGYWRKANQIHKWFVDNVQNGVDECQDSYVEMSQLKALKDTILEVLSTREPATAERLLPSQSGFFFGGTEYDEDYFRDLEHTLDVIARCEHLAEQQGYWDFYYRASW